MTKPQTAKIFMTGGSQAVRLPAEFRFEGKEVRIRRDPATGDVILSRVESWEEYFEWAQKQDWGPPLERDDRLDDFVDRSGLSKVPSSQPTTAKKARKRG